MLRSLLLRLSAKPAIGRTLDRLPVSRPLVRRFVAGQRPEEAIEVLAGLDRAGFLSAVTYLGENVTTAQAARHAADIYCGLLDEIHRRGLRTTPSVKLTHLGLDLAEATALEQVERVLDRAAGTVVWLDMESSAYTDRTLAIYRRLRARWKNVACVVQAYLRRTESDLRGLIQGGATVRLCKGAYREPADRAFERKDEVDRSYARLAGRLLSPEAQAAGAYPAFATHDERLIRVITGQARVLGIAPDRLEFQMLYGIRPDLHRVLAEQSIRLRVLVPFGEDWYGYFVRRLAERPANVLFVLRNLRRGERAAVAPASG
ncbi:MAG TPA: proline dehydrogenase family protein [Solirubrobacterales bacterium]|nr:proline dehydrogenase family protein [Solirubrobacterales bacterium]